MVLSPVIAWGLMATSLVAADADLGGSSGIGSLDPVAAQARYDAPDWALRWADEFDTPGQPDPARWIFEKGLVRNKEAQYYTVNRPENTRIADGDLVITARKETYEGAQYTSGSVTTQNRFSLTYGKIEIRAKVPAGRGTWPALWTLGNDVVDPQVSWPACGEIDLMEYVGMYPERLFFTVHTKAYNHSIGTQKGHNIPCPRPWEDYHRYGVVWTPERIEWFFNGKPVFAFANDGQGLDTWPFNKPQYLLMNLAIGGSWGGQKGIDDTIFPAEMRIDYVRVWQRP